jgi:GH35 family endo-1,4-beta-xylanase
MVKNFSRRGVPIDGVGLQMHIPNLDADVRAIAANVARPTALGAQVHITELSLMFRYHWIPAARFEQTI